MRSPSKLRKTQNPMTIKTVLSSLVLLAAIGAAADTRPFSLEPLSPAFWNLFDRKAQMTKVGSDFGFTEGPVWDPAGFLWVSDETQNWIYKLDLRTGDKQKIIALGDPDGNTYDRQHRLLDCASVLRAVISPLA